MGGGGGIRSHCIKGDDIILLVGCVVFDFEVLLTVLIHIQSLKGGGCVYRIDKGECFQRFFWWRCICHFRKTYVSTHQSRSHHGPEKQSLPLFRSTFHRFCPYSFQPRALKSP